MTEPESGVLTAPPDLAASFVSIPHVDGVAALLAALKTPDSATADAGAVSEAVSVSAPKPVEAAVVVAPVPSVAEPEPEQEPVVSPTYLSTLVATIVADVALLAPVTEPGGTELVAYDPTTAFGISNPTYFGSPLKLRVVQRSDDGEVAAGAVAGSSEPYDRLDPSVAGDVVVDVDIGPGGSHDENDACVGRVNVGS